MTKQTMDNQSKVAIYQKKQSRKVGSPSNARILLSSGTHLIFKSPIAPTVQGSCGLRLQRYASQLCMLQIVPILEISPLINGNPPTKEREKTQYKSPTLLHYHVMPEEREYSIPVDGNVVLWGAGLLASHWLKASMITAGPRQKASPSESRCQALL